jgi:type II secretory pathway pseudopilin PulG
MHDKIPSQSPPPHHPHSQAGTMAPTPRTRGCHCLLIVLALVLIPLAATSTSSSTSSRSQHPQHPQPEQQQQQQQQQQQHRFIPGQEAAKLQGRLFHCAWQFETSHGQCNMGVIDRTARYAGWTVFPNHRVYKLAGRYPTEGVYYAITVYDTSGVHILGGMADFQIAPLRTAGGTGGGNPYRELGVGGGGDVGEYEVHIVTDGRSRGLPNEIVLGAFWGFGWVVWCGDVGGWVGG